MMEREFAMGASGPSSSGPSASSASGSSASSGSIASSSAYHLNYQHPSKTNTGNNINYFFESNQTFKKPHHHNQFHVSPKYDQEFQNQQKSFDQQGFEKSQLHQKVEFQYQPQAGYLPSSYGTQTYQYPTIQASAPRFDQCSTIPVHHSHYQPNIHVPQFQSQDHLERNAFFSPNVQIHPNQLQNRHLDKNNQQFLHHLHLQKTRQAQEHQMYKTLEHVSSPHHHPGYAAQHPQYSQYQTKYNLRHSYLQYYNQHNEIQHCAKVPNQHCVTSPNQQNQQELIQQYLKRGNQQKSPHGYDPIALQRRQSMESMPPSSCPSTKAMSPSSCQSMESMPPSSCPSMESMSPSSCQSMESMPPTSGGQYTNSLAYTDHHSAKGKPSSNCISTKEGFDFWMGYMGTDLNEPSNHNNLIHKAKEHNNEEHIKSAKRPFKYSEDDSNENTKRFKDNQLEIEQTEGDGGYYTEPDSDINAAIDRDNEDLNGSFESGSNVKLFNCSYCKKKNIVYHCSCRRKVYCGRPCQEADWEEGGHQHHPDHN